MEQQPQIQIAVFDNNSDNPKAPQQNVVVTFPNGEKLEGGLWERTSKAGNPYRSGFLRKKDDQSFEARRPSEPRSVPNRAASKEESKAVDW